MKIYRISAITPPTIWRIKAKVFSGEYLDMGVEIEAKDRIEAKKKFYSQYPSKARQFDPENVSPEPDIEKTQDIRQKRDDEIQRAKANIKRQKEKEQDFAANQWDQFK